MAGRDAGALAIYFDPRVGRVELNMLDAAARSDNNCAFSTCFEAFQHLVLDLHIPGVVVFPGLQHGSCRRDRITTTLELDGIEIGAIGW
jgi:hypothetical protein